MTQGELSGIVILKPQVFHDERGCFYESYQAERFAKQLLPEKFVQDNCSRSQKNVLRGLHFQKEHPQGKLVFVTFGSILDVMVDIRLGSPTFGKAMALELNDQNCLQVYIPPGFAHGFCVLSERADVTYKCTDFYSPMHECGLIWNDPDLQIPWPIMMQPIISQKDQVYSRLKDFPKDQLPQFI